MTKMHKFILSSSSGSSSSSSNSSSSRSSSSSSRSSSSSSGKTLFCPEFKSSAKGTSIFELKNIKIERDNYNV